MNPDHTCTCGHRDQHVVNDLADIPILDQMQPVHPSDHDFLPARTVDRSTNTR